MSWELHTGVREILCVLCSPDQETVRLDFPLAVDRLRHKRIRESVLGKDDSRKKRSGSREQKSCVRYWHSACPAASTVLSVY